MHAHRRAMQNRMIQMTGTRLMTESEAQSRRLIPTRTDAAGSLVVCVCVCARVCLCACVRLCVYVCHADRDNHGYPHHICRHSLAASTLLAAFFAIDVGRNKHVLIEAAQCRVQLLLPICAVESNCKQHTQSGPVSCTHIVCRQAHRHALKLHLMRCPQLIASSHCYCSRGAHAPSRANTALNLHLMRCPYAEVTPRQLQHSHNPLDLQPYLCSALESGMMHVQHSCAGQQL